LTEGVEIIGNPTILCIFHDKRSSNGAGGWEQGGKRIGFLLLPFLPLRVAGHFWSTDTRNYWILSEKKATARRRWKDLPERPEDTCVSGWDALEEHHPTVRRTEVLFCGRSGAVDHRLPLCPAHISK